MKTRRRQRSLRKKERELFTATILLMGFKKQTNLRNSDTTLFLHKEMRVIMRPKFINLYIFRNTEQKPAEGVTLDFSIKGFLGYLARYE